MIKVLSITTITKTAYYFNFKQLNNNNMNNVNVKMNLLAKSENIGRIHKILQGLCKKNDVQITEFEELQASKVVEHFHTEFCSYNQELLEFQNEKQLVFKDELFPNFELKKEQFMLIDKEIDDLWECKKLACNQLLDEYGIKRSKKEFWNIFNFMDALSLNTLRKLEPVVLIEDITNEFNNVSTNVSELQNK